LSPLKKIWPIWLALIGGMIVTVGFAHDRRQRQKKAGASGTRHEIQYQPESNREKRGSL
jgi:hypothetical protein